MAVHINWFGVIPDWGLDLTNVQGAAAMIDGLLDMRALMEAGNLIRFRLSKRRLRTSSIWSALLFLA